MDVVVVVVSCTNCLQVKPATSWRQIWCSTDCATTPRHTAWSGGWL